MNGGLNINCRPSRSVLRGMCVDPAISTAAKRLCNQPLQPSLSLSFCPFRMSHCAAGAAPRSFRWSQPLHFPINCSHKTLEHFLTGTPSKLYCLSLELLPLLLEGGPPAADGRRQPDVQSSMEMQGKKAKGLLLTTEPDNENRKISAPRTAANSPIRVNAFNGMTTRNW